MWSDDNYNFTKFKANRKYSFQWKFHKFYSTLVIKLIKIGCGKKKSYANCR